MPVSTKQFVTQLTQSLIQKGKVEGAKPNTPESLTVFANETCRILLKDFGDLQVVEGIVAMGYAAATFTAGAIVSTAKTPKELAEQLNMIAELLATTFKMSASAAWESVHGEAKKPLIVSVPEGAKS